MEVKKYILLDSEGKEYLSDKPGTIGGNKKLKIYGRLDCPSAKRWIEKGYYVGNRVFFDNEETAILAGYRPCAVCMKEEYRRWKDSQKKHNNFQMNKKIKNIYISEKNIISKEYAEQLKKLLEECSNQSYVDEKGMVRQRKRKF